MKQVSEGMDAKPVAYMEAGAYATFPGYSFIGLNECSRSGGVQSTARTGLVRSRQTDRSRCCVTPLTSIGAMTDSITKRRESPGGLSKNHGSNTAVQPARCRIKTHVLTTCYPLWSNAIEYY